MMENGSLLVVSGPSCSVNDKVVKIIVANSGFVRFPIHKTETPREGEIDGVHGHFVDEETFARLLLCGDLLDEFTHVGWFYGFSVGKISEALKNGKKIIIPLRRVESAFLVKRIFPHAIKVFITSPSHEELIDAGGNDIRCVIAERMARLLNMSMHEAILNRYNTQEQVKHCPCFCSTHSYDLVVVNYRGDEEKTAKRICEFVSQICVCN